MNITNCGSQLTTDIINKFEEQFDIKLPNHYKRFMLENNGGKPQGNWSYDFV